MMQSRQMATNLERKGPHKSMHCKFCKPPGVVTPEKATRPQLETKTKIHLAHEAADLRLCDIQDEPGIPESDFEACVCVLEGENPCSKCVPDKNRASLKKKTCRCPKGAKQNPNMYDGATPKKKKQKEEDDEFWWEKYSREHDAIAKETWLAYMAQRRKYKKLAKCEKREEEELIKKKSKDGPDWYQKLSCQQMIYVEFLSTAIRLDSDENITDRTFFVLGGLGLYPRPKRKILKKCLRYCHYNSIQFLNQLHLLTKDDDIFNEKGIIPGLRVRATQFTWNERLIMNSICHLEFPKLLRELMDRLPPLPRDPILPPIPYPVYPKLPKKKYDNPYEEPIWQERVNWVDKMRIDRLNRSRAYMDTKRIKIPPLALVRRPSLIDARPPFLAQIEANERALKRMQKQKERKTGKKHPVSTFNSSVDMTAIAGIEASEISTTDKADTDEICVFLREPLKEPDFIDEDEMAAEKEVKFVQEEPQDIPTEIDRIKRFSDLEEYSDTEDEIPFQTPPKTESGVTIEQICPPPKPSPGPPALHYDVAKRELDIINEDLCRFYPFVTSSTQTVLPGGYSNQDEVTLQLLSAAKKLEEFAEESDAKDDKKIRKKVIKRKKNKCKKRKLKRGAKIKKKIEIKKSSRSSKAMRKNEEKEIETEKRDKEKETEEVNENEKEMETEELEDEEILEDEDFIINYRSNLKKEKNKLSKKESIISDPDPDSDDEWYSRPICIENEGKAEGDSSEKVKKKTKLRRKKKGKCKKIKRNKMEKKEQMKKMTELNEERGEYKKIKEIIKMDKETMTECYPGQFDHLFAEKKSKVKSVKQELEQGTVFEGKIGPLLKTLIRDLADEGYISASYVNVNKHPDIEQLIQYLRGEIVTKDLKEELHLLTKTKWTTMKGLQKFQIPELHISSKKAKLATWKDKGWISRLAKAKKDEFYFKAASSRAEYGREIYKTLKQNYFGTGRYLKIYYAYMLPKYEEAILRGVV